RPVAASISFENDTTVAIDDGYRAPSSTTGVKEERISGGLSVFVAPNPTSDVFSVNISSVASGYGHVSVLNVLGETVLELEPFRVTSGGTERVSVPTSALP